MDQDQGIRQTPFSDAWPTPDVKGQGLQGIGGGHTDAPGPQGIINSPFDKAIVPTPSGECTPVPAIGYPPDYTVNVDGADQAGSQAPWDITSSRNTIDRK